MGLQNLTGTRQDKKKLRKNSTGKLGEARMRRDNLGMECESVGVGIRTKYLGLWACIV